MIAKSSLMAAAGVCLTIPFLTSCGDQTAPTDAVAAPITGCAETVDPIKENPDFTPYDDQLSHPINEDHWSIGRLSEPGALPEQLNGEDASLDGLPAVAATLPDAGYYTVAYGDRAPAASLSEFLKSGGIVVDVGPGEGNGASIARDLYNETKGDGQIVLVEVGAYEAAVGWADPDKNGVREHHVVWTNDRGQDVNLYGVRTAEELVAIARGMVCG